MCIIIALLSLTSVTGFQIRHSTSICSQQFSRTSFPSSIILHSENPKETQDEETIVLGESYSSSIDWDAEWKKVVENKDQPAKRPNPVSDRSELEIRATIAKNRVAKNVFDASNEMKRSVQRNAPSWSSLQGDWRVSEH
jgi:hypothetical protein